VGAGLFNLFAPFKAVGEPFDYASGNRPPLQLVDRGARCKGSHTHRVFTDRPGAGGAAILTNEINKRNQHLTTFCSPYAKWYTVGRYWKGKFLWS